jgi:hypothetical protein
MQQGDNVFHFIPLLGQWDYFFAHVHDGIQWHDPPAVRNT